jgi:ribonuclease HI
MLNTLSSAESGQHACLTVYTGGACRGNLGHAGAGAVLVCPPARFRLKVFRYLGPRTSNEAEYEALLMGLKRALRHGFRQVEIRSSSELMVKQLNGNYRVKSAGLQPLHAKALELLARFERWRAQHLAHQRNMEAHRLAMKAIDAHVSPAPVAASSTADRLAS